MSQTFSMTGYGKELVTFRGCVITIELRTLNSKQTDINVRMPALYREHELEIRDLLNIELVRGKIDLSIQREVPEGKPSSVINQAAAEDYYKQIKAIEERLNLDSTKPEEYLQSILRLPEIMSSLPETLEEDEYLALMEGLRNCVNRVNEFRTNEGAKLATALLDSAQRIENRLMEIQPLEKERIEKIKSRINRGLTEYMTDKDSVDQDRFEQELIYYLEKLDFSEEKVRLQAHCEHFNECMQNEAIKGKKLSFISQEMGREINTLGSKAQHAEIQRLVVDMKDELERIKEQVLNVL